MCGFIKFKTKADLIQLKLQYFGHLMRRADSLEKTLMLGKIEGKRRVGDRGWNGWVASPTQCTWTWANSGRCWRTGKPGALLSMGLQRAGHDWATGQRRQQKPACAASDSAPRVWGHLSVPPSVMDPPEWKLNASGFEVEIVFLEFWLVFSF